MTKKSVQALIICSWALLFICLVIKLCGRNWFELKSSNETFIKFCEEVDSNQFLKIIIACNNYIFTGYPIICLTLNQKNLTIKQTLIFIPIMIFKSILNWYFSIISAIIDIIILILIPLLLKRFKNWKRVIIVNIMVVAFQLLTIAIRNIGIGKEFNTNATLINSLMQIDYILMIVICYLYNLKYLINRKEEQ